MPDMLVRLYDLPDPRPYYEAAAGRGFTVRRAEPWEREALPCFVRDHFNPPWAAETARAFNHTPITAYVAVRGPQLAGFAVYECTRRGFFGPTGVREEDRGNGLGAALLFRCLESMREMGYAYAVIGGVGPAAFYEKVCGAFIIPGSDISVYGPLYESMSRERA
ncbi:MAG: GNAT family N-acetyltransferase [Chloroflexi bacterium]|nr:MAG: GNAT family N-acetyltransferase [Chloroflexota bacterium]